MMTSEELQNVCTELVEYAKLDGTELGETCFDLAQLSESISFLSEPFQQALQLELRHQLTNFKEHSKIITKTFPAPPIVFTGLEWDNQ